MAALVIGARDARILFRHLVINAVGPIIVQVTFLVPNAIFTEAFLSFIGIGISAPMASWGSMAQDARQVFFHVPGTAAASDALYLYYYFCAEFPRGGNRRRIQSEKVQGVIHI